MTYPADMPAEAQVEAKMALDAVALAGQMLAMNEGWFRKLHDSEQYMHNVGGLLDPTLYKRMLSEENGKRNSAAAAAARRFLADLRACGYLPAADDPAEQEAPCDASR